VSIYRVSFSYPPAKLRHFPEYQIKIARFLYLFQNLSLSLQKKITKVNLNSSRRHPEGIAADAALEHSRKSMSPIIARYL
jgi:hypothetical protein